MEVFYNQRRRPGDETVRLRGRRTMRSTIHLIGSSLRRIYPVA
jgi:hypothetical protein